MLNDFMIRAALAGVGVALAAGPLGCFVLWRRMAYFGDALAHAAVLGVALSLGFSVSIFVGVLLVAVVVALGLGKYQERLLAVDTMLGVISYSALAFGLVIVSLLPGQRLDLDAYLFGDILTVSKGDLGIIWCGALLVLGVLVWRWDRLLSATVSPELAVAEGVDPKKERMVLMLLLAVLVAVAIKIIGALLIGAMLIIPAATARAWVFTPEQMARVTVCFGAFAALVGVWGSGLLNTPTGPTIVCVAACLFGASYLFRK